MASRAQLAAMVNARKRRARNAGAGSPTPPPVAPVGTSAAARHQAGAADTVVVTINQSFAPSDVDLVNNRVNMSALGFDPISYPATLGPAVQGFIDSSGTPPGGLAKNTPYFAVDVAGGLAFYPMAAKGVPPLPSGTVDGEDVPPAQYFAQAENRIVITSQGTGTHRFYTNELASEVKDALGFGMSAGTTTTSNKHSFLERLADPDGKKFFKVPGITMQDNLRTANYSENGQFWISREDGPSRAAYVAKMAGARYAWTISVVRGLYDENFTVVRFKPTTVDTTTNIITFASHQIITGDPVYFKNLPGGVLPVPFVDGAILYARAVTTSTLTIHPTSADALANTNIIDIISAGSGDFQIVDPARTSDYRREGFFAEARGPDSGADCCSLQTSPSAPNFKGIRTLADWTTSGSLNGEINNMGGFPDLTGIRLRVPPMATMPPPAGGSPQVVGETTYWVTHKPGSSVVIRIHATLADAASSVGVATASSNCLKFSGAGFGTVLWNYIDDGYLPFAFGQNKNTVRAVVATPARMPIGSRKAYTALCDYNDPAGGITGPQLYVGCNAIGTTPNALAGTKGNLSSTQNAAIAAFARFNSGQPHVPLLADEFDWIIGFSNSDPRADMQAWLDYYTAEYALT